MNTIRKIQLMIILWRLCILKRVQNGFFCVESTQKHPEGWAIDLEGVLLVWPSELEGDSSSFSGCHHVHTWSVVVDGVNFKELTPSGQRSVLMKLRRLLPLADEWRRTRRSERILQEKGRREKIEVVERKLG